MVTIPPPHDAYVQPVGKVPSRPAWLAIAAAAILAVALGASWLSAWLPDRLRSAEDIVAASVLAYAAPPALDMRVWVDGTGHIRYLYDGAGTWRREYPSATGWHTSFDLSSGRRYAFYDADARAFVELDTVGVTPTPSWGADTCPTPRRLADATVAGRPTYVVECTTTRYWIDRQTMLILREVGAPRPGVPLAYREEVEAFALEPALSPSAFTFAPPQGAVAMTWREYIDHFLAHDPG